MTDINPNVNLSDKIRATLRLLDEISGKLSVFDDQLLQVDVATSTFAIAKLLPLLRTDVDGLKVALDNILTENVTTNQNLNLANDSLTTANIRLVQIRDCVCRTATAVEGLLQLELEDEDDDCLSSPYVSDGEAVGVIVTPPIALGVTPTYTQGSFPPQVDLSIGTLFGATNVVTIPQSELNDWRVKLVTDADNVFVFEGVNPLPVGVLIPDTWYPASYLSGKAAYIDRTTIKKRKKRKGRYASLFATTSVVAVWCYTPLGIAITNIAEGDCADVVSYEVTETSTNGTAIRYVAAFSVRSQGTSNTAGGTNFTTTISESLIANTSLTDDVGVVITSATTTVFFAAEENQGVGGVPLEVDNQRFWRSNHTKMFLIAEAPFTANVCVR